MKFQVFKVVCDNCQQGFYEPDEALERCPHCNEPASAPCGALSAAYNVIINPLTGEVSVAPAEGGV